MKEIEFKHCNENALGVVQIKVIRPDLLPESISDSMRMRGKLLYKRKIYTQVEDLHVWGHESDMKSISPGVYGWHPVYKLYKY